MTRSTHPGSGLKLLESTLNRENFNRIGKAVLATDLEQAVTHHERRGRCSPVCEVGNGWLCAADQLSNTVLRVTATKNALEVSTPSSLISRFSGASDLFGVGADSFKVQPLKPLALVLLNSKLLTKNDQVALAKFAVVSAVKNSAVNQGHTKTGNALCVRVDPVMGCVGSPNLDMPVAEQANINRVQSGHPLSTGGFDWFRWRFFGRKEVNQGLNLLNAGVVSVAVSDLAHKRLFDPGDALDFGPGIPASRFELRF